MITLSITRQHAEYSVQTIFSYLNLLQLSNLKNVALHDKTSGEYLSVRLFNCLLQEIEYAVRRKLFTTTGAKLQIKLSDAQGIAFYKALLSMPVKTDQDYLFMIRNHWIEILDQQILKL